MAFPSDISPSGRSYSSGNYPSKAYNAQDGAEVRILYGNKRIGASLQLVYNNLTDTTAQLFLDHYDEMKGTFIQFSVSGNALRAGWTGAADALNAPAGTSWRYADEPRLESIYPGRSSVTVDLVAVSI